VLPSSVTKSRASDECNPWFNPRSTVPISFRSLDQFSRESVAISVLWVNVTSTTCEKFLCQFEVPTLVGECSGRTSTCRNVPGV
jgi:vesicle coat complex subunit